MARIVSRVAAASRPRARPAGGDSAAPDCPAGAAAFYFALFVVLISAVVALNANWNALIDDTLLFVSDFESLERFSSYWTNANADPLQALFDIFPSGHRLDAIPNIVARALLGPGWHMEFFYAGCAVLLGLSALLMARAVGLRRGVGLVAAIVLPLLIFPVYGYLPWAEDMYVLWPIIYYSVAGTTLVAALFWGIGRGSRRRDALVTAGIVAVLLHLSIVQIFHMTQVAPAIVAMGFGALAASTSRRELIAKLVCAVAIVAALAAAGIFAYLYASGVDGAQYIFYRELPNFVTDAPPSWAGLGHNLGEVFYSPLSPSFHDRSNIAGWAIVPLAQLGAVYLAVAGPSRDARIFGRTVLAWLVATAAAIVFAYNFFYYTGLHYLGPDPRHCVEILWPYYAICLACLVFAAAERVASLVSGSRDRVQVAPRWLPHGLVLLALRFSGRLDVELRQVFGPFWQSRCRIQDAKDAERLGFVDALGATAPPKQPVDESEPPSTAAPGN